MNVLRGQSQLGQLGLRGFHIDTFILRAPELHAGHTRHHPQFLADVLRILIELGIAEAVTGDRHQEAVDKAEVVTDLGCAGAGGKQVFHVADLFAHMVPDLG